MKPICPQFLAAKIRKQTLALAYLSTRDLTKKTMAIISQSLQTITQAASNSVQKMQVGSPAVTPVTSSSYNLNVLPAPIGYKLC